MKSDWCGVGNSLVMWSLSPFMRKSAVIRDAQVGQFDPSRVSIAADPEGGKLMDGDITAIVRCMR